MHYAGYKGRCLGIKGGDKGHIADALQYHVLQYRTVGYVEVI